MRLLAVVLLGLGCAAGTAQERSLPLERLRSGSTDMGVDLRAMQADEFANAGMLWVER